jgi:hypothetical protein
MNVFLVGVTVSLLGIDEYRNSASLLLREYWGYALTAVLGFEVGAWLLLGALTRVRKSMTAEADPFFHDSIDTLVIRFAVPEDYEDLLKVFREYFSDDTALTPEEYRLLMKPGGRLVRIMEGVNQSGNHKIIGYYSVWPMSNDTLSNLSSGRLKESEIDSSIVLPHGDDRAKTLYVGEIAISRGQPFGQVLMRDAKTFILHCLFTEKNIESVSAWGYSDIGRTLASRMGMKRITPPRKKKPSEFFVATKTEALDALLPQNKDGSRRSFATFEDTRTISV